MVPHLITSYAQNFEDVILWRAFATRGPGFYIDIGAQDPVFDSVSLAFYEQGWRGIHVEPTVQYAEMLRRSRTDEIVVQAAVSVSSGSLTFYEIPDSGVSTLFAHVAEEFGRRGWPVHRTSVPAITLDQVFELVPQDQNVYWLKIDAEGAETDILSSWRSSGVRPWVVLLEAIDSIDRSPNFAPWEPLILAKGYHFVYFDGLNRFYVADEHAELDQHFKFGPCLWDEFNLPESSRLFFRSFEATGGQQKELEAEVAKLRDNLALLKREFEGAKSEIQASHTARSAEAAMASAEIARLRRTLRKALVSLEQAEANLLMATLASNERSIAAQVQLNEASSMRSVSDLMGLSDKAFIEAAYELLLGRKADPDGFSHFSKKLRKGKARLAVLEEIRTSKEGRVRPPGLADIDDMLPGRQRGRDTILSRLHRRLVIRPEPMVAETEAIARQVDRLSAIVDAQERIARHTSQLHMTLHSVSTAIEVALQADARQPSDVAPASKVVQLDDDPGTVDMVRALKRALASRHVGLGLSAAVGDAAVPVDPTLKPAILVGQDWAETGYPAGLSKTINEQFSAVGCASRHARKILIDHGVRIPIAAIGLGVDTSGSLAETPIPRSQEGGFRFVHVAKDFLEDGTDLALQAFGRVFSQHADVSLLVACLPEAETRIRAELSALGKKNADFHSRLQILPGTWNDAELAALFSRCHVLLAPGRAAMSRSPVALAVHAGLPVIATGWGGHLDYCPDACAWLVDYEFEWASSRRNLAPSAWARSLDLSLDEALRAARSAGPDQLVLRADLARRLLKARFSWDAVTERLIELSQNAVARHTLREPHVGWVSTWNVKCGIASAVANLVETLPQENIIIYAAEQQIFAGKQEPLLGEDSSNCARLWRVGKEQNNLAAILADLDRAPLDALIIHFNYGWFNHAELGRFISDVSDRGIAVVIDLHSTIDPSPHPNMQLRGFLSGLQKCHRILAHAPADMNRLKALGLIENVSLFPLGVVPHLPKTGAKTKGAGRPVLASFGFCLPGKGLPELVEAVSLLRAKGRTVRLLMLNAQYPHPQSEQEIESVRSAIERFGLSREVEFKSDYLPQGECLSLLGEADLIVNPYQATSEAASAAARLSLASGSPLLVTPISIFDDLQGAVFRTTGTTPQAIADGIVMTLDHIERRSSEYRAVHAAATQWLIAHDFRRQGVTLARMSAALRWEMQEGFA